MMFLRTLVFQIGTITVGASLLAIAVLHSTIMLTEPPPSRASSLPQVLRLGLKTKALIVLGPLLLGAEGGFQATDLLAHLLRRGAAPATACSDGGFQRQAVAHFRGQAWINLGQQRWGGFPQFDVVFLTGMDQRAGD